MELLILAAFLLIAGGFLAFKLSRKKNNTNHGAGGSGSHDNGNGNGNVNQF